MFNDDIKNIYIKNHIKKIYIVKRHNENINTEEKKSSILYKNFDDFVSILVNIRKHDNLLKKLKANINDSDSSKILLDYLDFYVNNFGYKFHSFIIEYKNDSSNDDINNCYAISKLSKNDIEQIVKNSYSRVLYKYDGIKYLLYYIKKHTLSFENVNPHFMKLLSKYLYVSLNPLNLLIFIYLKIYKNGTKNSKEFSEDNGKQHNDTVTIQENNTNGNDSLIEKKDTHSINNNLNRTNNHIKDSEFFCNELFSYMCSYGEYIIKRTIISCYSEIYNNNKNVRGKLKIYKWTKNYIENYIIGKLSSHYFSNGQVNNDINKYFFNAYANNLNEYIKKYKIFTEVSSGFKNINMSNRKFSYIYELILFLYFSKKCLYHLNENINFVYQLSLYILYKSIKMIITYLYFNLPEYMCHYFLNIYIMFFKKKRENVPYIMKKLKKNYRNVMVHVNKQKKSYIRAKLCNSFIKSRTSSDNIITNVSSNDGGNNNEEKAENKDMKKLEIIKTKLKSSESKRIKKALSLTYFDINNYDKRKDKIEGYQLNKFLNFHSHGSIIQLKYNNEEQLRKKEREKKKNMTKKNEQEENKITTEIDKLDAKTKNQINGLIYPNKFEIIKRYSLLYNMYYNKKNYNTIDNSLQNIFLNVNAMHKGKKKKKKNENTKNQTENKNKNTNDSASNKGIAYKKKCNIFSNKKNIRSPKVANTVFKSIFENIFKQNEHLIGSISYEDDKNKIDVCVDENKKNNNNEDEQKLQKQVDDPVNTDLNEKENVDISIPNDIGQSDDKLDENQLKEQIDNDNAVINESHNEEQENELEGQAIKEDIAKDEMGKDNIVKDEMETEDLPLDAPTKCDTVKDDITNDDDANDVIIIDDIMKEGLIKTQVNTACLNINEIIINDNYCKKEIEKKIEKESLGHIVNANNKGKHFKAASKKSIYYISGSSSSDDSTDDEEFVIGNKRSTKKKHKRKKKGKKKESRSARKRERKSFEFENKKENQTSYRRSKRLMNIPKYVYYISDTSKEPKLINSNKISKIDKSPIKVHDKKEKDIKETNKHAEKTIKVKESNTSSQELKEKEKIYDNENVIENIDQNKIEISNKDNDINDEENNKDDKIKNIMESDSIFSHDNNDIESSSKNGVDSTNIDEDNDEKGEAKDIEQVTKENVDGDEKNQNSFKKRNSRNLIFDLSFSDSENDILLVDTRSIKKKEQNFYEIEETNASISDDGNINKIKNLPIIINNSLIVNKNNIKICDDDNDDMKRRKTEYMRLQGDYDIINEKNRELYRESKEQEKPFLDTCEAYLNEKVDDNEKIEVQTSVKLIVIYLFDHFIVGAINLINPYNIAEKERYNYFTQVQSNINDTNHTQIYKYNSNENHSNNTIFTNFEVQGALKKNTKIHLLSIKNEKRVLTILTKHGKGINGCIYKCLVNGKLMACKIQKKLYLAKKEIYFSYILKTRRSNKLTKYEKRNILSRHNNNDGNKHIFYEILKEHESRYIFPDELHYKIVDLQKGNNKSAKLLQSYYKTNNNENNDIEVGNSLLLMNTFKNVKTVNDIINYFIKKNYNTINEEFILFIVYQMVVAVLQLHILDVVHGDIKIDNILVSKDDNQKGEGKDKETNDSSDSKSKETNSTRNKSASKKETTHSGKYGSKNRSTNEGKNKQKKTKSAEISQISAGKVIDYFLNSELNKDSDKSFLKKNFPVNLFLVDIGRGIDMKNFKKYMFYGDKYCDCYNFLTDSIFTYHIDLIGIAQVASCLLFYKHIGNTKYKYEKRIEDKTTISVNNFDITYMTHNSHFLKTNINRNNDHATKVSKSRYKELENFIKIKEKLYRENDQLNDKNKSTSLLNNSFRHDTTGTKLREKNDIPSSVIKRKRSSNEDENISNKKINCENEKYKNQNCKDNDLKKTDHSNGENLDDIYFMDYFRIFPIDKKINEKINNYFNQIKKNGDNYFVEKAEKKIKSFYVKLLLSKKKYAHFWEIFFHVLLNFCNVYELDNIKYNSNDINLINEEINSFSNNKIINKENNYYFDFEKKNWNEIDHKKGKSIDTFKHDKNKKYENSGNDAIMISHNNEGIKNKLNKNTKLINLNAKKINTVIDICSKDTASNNGDSEEKLSFYDINNTGKKNKLRDHSYDFYNNNYCDNTKDNIYSDKMSNTSKNNPMNERDINLNDKNKRDYNNIADLKKENKNNPTTTTNNNNNNKYFFIKNSLSNLKVIKKTVYNNKNTVEKDVEKSGAISKTQTKIYNYIGKDAINNKRKFYFFENEQNKRKCRKLNNKKYYNNNDTKKSTRYINKLLKKKAIITLVSIKKAIENIFENTETQDTLHKELNFISTIL